MITLGAKFLLLLFLLIRLEPSPGVRVTKVGASHPFLAHLEQVKDLVLERAALNSKSKQHFENVPSYIFRSWPRKQGQPRSHKAPHPPHG